MSTKDVSMKLTGNLQLSISVSEAIIYKMSVQRHHKSFHYPTGYYHAIFYYVLFQFLDTLYRFCWGTLIFECINSA